MATLMAVFGIVNTRVNPLGVTPTPWTDTTFRDYRPIYRSQRTAKPGLIRSEKWDAVMMGSSRVDIALDPSNPHWGDLRVANLAFSAGSLPESAAMFKYAADRQNLQLAIVGVDLYDLTVDYNVGATAGFTESPLNDKADPVERELRYIFGYNSVQASFNAIVDRSKKHLPEYTANGHRLRHKPSVDLRHKLETDSIPHAIRFIRQRKADHGLVPAKLQAFREILETAKQKKLRLVLMIPPNHALYVATYFYAGDPDPAFDLERNTVVNLAAEADAKYPGTPPIEIWDFYDFHPLNAETVPPLGDKTAQMQYWMDGTHALKSLGDIMLARMMGWPLDGPGADYGVRLTPENLQARDQQLRAGYEDYQKSHPDEFKWMTTVASKYSDGNAPPDEE
jgi:hypothetical protein